MAPLLKIAVFDMDNTLIGCDCDMTWKSFAVRRGLAASSALAESEKFLADYDRGELDEKQFMRFQWAEICGRSRQEMAELSREHFREEVLPCCRAKAKAEISALKKAGVYTFMLTSTAAVLAFPVAEYFGVDEFAGTEIRMDGDIFTSELSGLYLCGENKRTFVSQLAAARGVAPANIRAYGDSINDLELLKFCGEAVAVTPSPALRREAEKAAWKIVDWKNDGEKAKC